MKVSIGPITRLEGHLDVKTEVVDNKIINAEASGEMYRGIENILKGRDPLDAQQMTQRICGVCPYAHGIASSYAQEQAYNLTPPPNGRKLHNLIQGANHLFDYLLHFYQLSAPDFFDITAIHHYNGNDVKMNNIKTWVTLQEAHVKPYPVSPFLPRLPGNYVEDTDLNLTMIRNYIKAIEMQMRANQACAIFGGRFPHATAVFPGGVTQAAKVDFIIKYQSLIKDVRDFIIGCYLPDVIALAQAYSAYWHIGISKAGLLSFGLMPLSPDHRSKRLFSAGVWIDKKIEDVDFLKIREDVRYAKYTSSGGKNVRESNTIPSPKKKGAYTWTKAPRYNGHAMEVGPTARVLVDYYQDNNAAVKKLVDKYTGDLNIAPEQLNSVMGRHLSRAICASVIADFLMEESERIDVDAKTIEKINVPESGEGFGSTEASRGALLHYINIKEHKVFKYQCIVPTTWNISPKDDNGINGPIESALIGTRVENPEHQIESGRVVRSFDPCMACSVH